MIIVLYTLVADNVMYCIAERSSKLADVESKWEGKKVNLDGELEKMEKLLADTFDRYNTKKKKKKWRIRASIPVPLAC